MSFGELVLVLGDLHIPYRTSEIATKFRDLLVPDKIPTLVCTGNLCTVETLDYIKSIAPNVHCVRGDMDDSSLNLPEELVFEVGDFRIGVIHGHQIVPWGDLDCLSAVARRLEVDVLISGHTHVNETVEWNGKCFINPGSLTGAFSPTSTTGIKASFICMSVKSDTITNYVYELLPDSTSVQKHKWSYTKGGNNNNQQIPSSMPTSKLDSTSISSKEARLFGGQPPTTTTINNTPTTISPSIVSDAPQPKTMETIELQDDHVIQNKLMSSSTLSSGDDQQNDGEDETVLNSMNVEEENNQAPPPTITTTPPIDEEEQQQELDQQQHQQEVVPNDV
jgi:vacuolar protein sorting-associated protein 29